MKPEEAKPIVTMQPEVAAQPEPASAPGQSAAEVPAEVPNPSSDQPVKWQAPEQINEYRPPVWYLFFIIVVLALLAGAVFLIKSYTFAALVVVMAVTFVVYTRRTPRLVNYILSPKGLYADDRLYSFGEFRSFGIIQEPDRNTLKLIPTKRFSPGIEAYFPSEVGEVIVDILAARLPMQDMQADSVDKLSRRLKL